jgi:hypothetical protein
MVNPVTFGLWQLEPSSVMTVTALSDVHFLQRALARGDSLAIRAHGDSVRAFPSGALRRGDADLLYQEALVLLAVADTAAATLLLDQTLDGLSAGPRWLIEDVHRAATIALAMRLRALLAASAGEEATARLWARRTLALWRGADRELHPFLGPLRSIADSANE